MESVKKSRSHNCARILVRSTGTILFLGVNTIKTMLHNAVWWTNFKIIHCSLCIFMESSSSLLRVNFRWSQSNLEWRFIHITLSTCQICESFSSELHAVCSKLLLISASVFGPYFPWTFLIFSSCGSVWLTKWLSWEFDRPCCLFRWRYSPPLTELNVYCHVHKSTPLRQMN
jgi:hypothetical protein